MRQRVEDLPRLDASNLAWSGVLDQKWRADGGSECWALDTLGDSFKMSFGDCQVMTHLRPIASAPRVRGPNHVSLFIRFEMVASDIFALERPYLVRRFDLVATRPHLGGARWWFWCRECRKRRAHFYPDRSGTIWSCAACHGLTYESRARYGRSGRRGHGVGALRYMLDRDDARDLALQRRNWRRGLSRRRQQLRESEGGEWPVALTCLAPHPGNTQSGPEGDQAFEPAGVCGRTRSVQ